MNDKIRFLRKVDVQAPDECWPWISGMFKQEGYGAFYYKGKNHGAHRVSLAWKLNLEPEDIEIACHTCDNRKCVNPNHLFNGTHSDNMKDMVAKGRHAKPSVKKSECIRGHRFLEGSFFYRPASGNRGPERICKECIKIREALRRLRRGQGTRFENIEQYIIPDDNRVENVWPST